ncbi:MAG: PAS domain-containing protein [Gelidibacter sp.]
MAKNLNDMMCLDIYLSSLNKEQLEAIDDEINSVNIQTMPLLSWDIYSDYHFSQLKELKRNLDILKVKALARKLNWKVDLNALFEKETFEAIVVTDLNQKIIWVNEGFTEMTGYSKIDALNKTPRFLQGPKSCREAKERIRIKLSGIEPFKEVIINYRKNRDAYECEVKIFPIYNQETTHFIALEKLAI